MSRYDALWDHVARQQKAPFTLSFDDIGRIAGVPLDHSFLNCKKELLSRGWEVGKISLKGQTVGFRPVDAS